MKGRGRGRDADDPAGGPRAPNTGYSTYEDYNNDDDNDNNNNEDSEEDMAGYDEE